MASTSTAEPSAVMEESRNWLEMPPEVMASILQRLGAVEILNSARKVCTTWRRICKDPSMWKVVDIHSSFYDWVTWDTNCDLETLTKQAVDLSCGELIDITIYDLGTDDLLDYIVQRSSNLKSLCLRNCYNITDNGLIQAVKRVPNLEKLHLSYISIKAEDIEVLGQNCPHLKSFTMAREFKGTFFENDKDALAIANNMPELRNLQVFANKMTNIGLEAILKGCPHLESLDVRRCFNLNLNGDLGKLCAERIRDFKRPNDSTENCEFRYRIQDHDEFSEDDVYEFSDGRESSEAGDHDYSDDYIFGETAQDLADDFSGWIDD